MHVGIFINLQTQLIYKKIIANSGKWALCMREAKEFLPQLDSDMLRPEILHDYRMIPQ